VREEIINMGEVIDIGGYRKEQGNKKLEIPPGGEGILGHG
jgi:hypothetical protein